MFWLSQAKGNQNFEHCSSGMAFEMKYCKDFFHLGDTKSYANHWLDTSNLLSRNNNLLVSTTKEDMQHLGQPHKN